MIYGSPMLVTLTGDAPRYGFWATVATAAAKVGSGVAKRIAKRVRARRKRNKLAKARKLFLTRQAAQQAEAQRRAQEAAQLAAILEAKRKRQRTMLALTAAGVGAAVLLTQRR